VTHVLYPPLVEEIADAFAAMLSLFTGLTGW
jgi:hypothetical protein